MIETLQRMYRYQDWAMEQLWPGLEKLTGEQLDTPGCSGVGTIRQTLAHLIAVQNGWFEWFDGSKTPEQAQASRRSAAPLTSIDEARRLWRQASDRAEACVATLTEADLAKVWTAARPDGNTLALPLGELLLHVANHGTHTRAQIAAAVRRAGGEPGVLEYTRFAMTQAQPAVAG